MTGAPRFDRYDWRGGGETMLRFGPDEGPVVIAALPLFEEANRTRTFIVAILRALATRGIGSVLPDVPSQGESLVPLQSVSLADLQGSFAEAASRTSSKGRPVYIVAIRSGALLVGKTSSAGCWALSPQDGPALIRELTRVKQADLRLDEHRYDDAPVEIAGNLLSPSLLNNLGTAQTMPDRVVRLASELADADLKIDGPALWRRSEPGNDPVFAQALADDIADWIARCEG